MVSRFPPRPASPRAEIELQEEMRTTGQRPIPRPAAFPTFDRGRSPGSWDRAYRLPVGLHPQWLLIRPHALTVAGAAEALAIEISPFRGRRTSFPFHPGAGNAPGHLERAR